MAPYLYSWNTRAIVIGYGPVLHEITVAKTDHYLLTVVKHLNPNTITTDEYDTLADVANALDKLGFPEQATQVRAAEEPVEVATGSTPDEPAANVGEITGTSGTATLGAELSIAPAPQNADLPDGSELITIDEHQYPVLVTALDAGGFTAITVGETNPGLHAEADTADSARQSIAILIRAWIEEQKAKVQPVEGGAPGGAASDSIPEPTDRAEATIIKAEDRVDGGAPSQE